MIEFVGKSAQWRKLGHGFRVQLRIVVWQKDDAVRVPVGSLFRNGGDWAVFTVEDGIASQRNIRIGQRNAEYAEILEGISNGDAVIRHPSDRIADGVTVVSRDTR